MTLSAQEQQLALATARAAVAAALQGSPAPPLPSPPPALAGPGGAFVTLHLDGVLRGCIGCLDGPAPVLATVARMARAAALEDPRFPQLLSGDLPRVTLEVSLLSSPILLDNPRDVVPGRHGLLVTQGRRRGVLLPQVASAQGWDRERFLQETCRKAGLPPDAWRRSAQVHAFEAEVFGEAPSPVA